jgi:hypothetical protein
VLEMRSAVGRRNFKSSSLFVCPNKKSSVLNWGFSFQWQSVR